MLKLDYYLAVHSPFRPFEGHMIELKTRMGLQLSSLKFDIEAIRPFSTEFFRVRSLLTEKYNKKSYN